MLRPAMPRQSVFLCAWCVLCAADAAVPSGPPTAAAGRLRTAHQQASPGACPHPHPPLRLAAGQLERP
jgi:hypothetical protein